MEWITIAVATLAVGVLAKRLIDSAERKRQARVDLQFWEADLAPGETECGSSIEVHFPSMLMKSTFWNVDGADTLRVFHVRRQADGTWEMRMTAESYDIECRNSQDVGYTKEELEALEKTGRDWRPLRAEVGSLETAYQRFIHAQDVPITDPEADWRKKERQLAQREAHRQTGGTARAG
jgi:hypothetical protein